jgi:hypothetical protein
MARYPVLLVLHSLADYGKARFSPRIGHAELPAAVGIGFVFE